MKYTISKTCPSAVGSVYGETTLTSFATRAQGVRRKRYSMNREDEVKGSETFEGVALCIIIRAHHLTYPFNAKVNQNKSQKKDKNSLNGLWYQHCIIVPWQLWVDVHTADNSSKTLWRRFRSLKLHNNKSWQRRNNLFSSDELNAPHHKYVELHSVPKKATINFLDFGPQSHIGAILNNFEELWSMINGLKNNFDHKKIGTHWSCWTNRKGGKLCSNIDCW